MPYVDIEHSTRLLIDDQSNMEQDNMVETNQENDDEEEVKVAESEAENAGAAGLQQQTSR